MKRKTAIRALRKDVSLTRRYGQIGIQAVAAAAPYHGKGKNEKSPAASRAEARYFLETMRAQKRPTAQDVRSHLSITGRAGSLA